MSIQRVSISTDTNDEISLDDPGSNEPGASDAQLLLSLTVRDPELVAELSRRAPGEKRDSFALLALRIGVLTLRQASGQLDVASINEAGGKLINEMSAALNARANDLSSQLGKSLTQYFDPSTGLLMQRIQSLVQKDGELERLLLAQMGPDDSILAKTLVNHLGEGSPLFNMLSPTHSMGLKAQIERILEDALAQQRERIMREFSLDHKESALSRLILEVTAQNEKLGQGLSGQVDGLVGELSLDRPDSALSRLVMRVEQANHTIANQFSSDNENSALSKLAKILQSTNAEISRSLSLDDETSALARMRREFQTALQEISTKNSDFHTDVKSTLSALQARKREADRSTQHGIEFEQELEKVVSMETQNLGDIWQSTGTSAGSIKNCKVGDFVTVLGIESHASGTRVVWEAKEDRSYDLKRALDEIEIARKNREAYMGIFVFSKKTAPEDLKPFARYGQDIVLVWDADDPSTDIYIKAAYSVARALSVRNERHNQEQTISLEHIEIAVRGIERQVKFLDDFKTWAETITRNGQKIAERSEKMKLDLQEEISKLDYLRLRYSDQNSSNTLPAVLPSGSESEALF